MRRLLGLALLILGCSSSADHSGPVTLESGGGSSGHTTGGGSEMPSAGAGAAPNSGGADSIAGTSGSSAGAGDGAPGGTGGTAGAAPTGGAAIGGSGGAAGSGGSSVAGGDTTGDGGAETSDPGDGGAGGVADQPDPCDGVTKWSNKSRLDTYSTGVIRHFAGKLWECRAADYCRYYPGNGEPDGWVAIDECSSGPVQEATCVCSSGDCCDGCYARPSSYFCGLQVYDALCYEDTRQLDYRNLFCSGTDPGECTRWSAHLKWEVYRCDKGTACVDAGTGGEDAECK